MTDFLTELFGDDLICTSYGYSVSDPGHPGIAIHTDSQPYGSTMFGGQASSPCLVRVLYYLDDLTPGIRDRLAAWREQQALRMNRPRQWIVKDTTLINLAMEQPANTDALQRIDGLPPKLIRRSGKDILAAIRAAGSDNNDYRPPPRPDESQKVLLKQMQQEVATCAEDLGLAGETVASKRDLSAIIIGGKRNSRVLNGWRRDLIGERLLELL